MYMSRICLQPDAAKKSSFWSALEDGYQIHRELWSLFADSNDRRRDFLYRQEEQRGSLGFFTVSDREPQDRKGLWQIESKPYHPKLTADQKLAFSVRANPIRSKRDDQGKQHRHDVIMDAKMRLRELKGEATKRPSEAEIVQREGCAWLVSRAASCGFSVKDSDVRVDGYRQHRWIKPKTGNLIRFSTVEITGILTVIDPQLFSLTLRQGIGPAKGFGCGLLLVRPV
jgi:CRISPR system Cascade subunit CasE